jgi:hypothetical protein
MPRRPGPFDHNRQLQSARQEWAVIDRPRRVGDFLPPVVKVLIMLVDRPEDGPPIRSYQIPAAFRLDRHNPRRALGNGFPYYRETDRVHWYLRASYTGYSVCETAA